jgi:hypothetical protein
MRKNVFKKLTNLTSWLAFMMPEATLLFSQSAMGQGKGISMKNTYQTMHFSIPIINFAGETTFHGEFNLAGEGGLAVELTGKKDLEEASADDQDKGISRKASAQALSFHYARYVEHFSMGGFYWSLGAGYRRETIDWLRVENPQGVEFSALENNTWNANLAELSGPTAHGRTGYRYVGKEIPLLVGVFAGLRHFSSSVKDVEGSSKLRAKDSSETVRNVPPVTAMTMSDKDKTKLQNIYATRLEGGIEIGFTF